MSPAAIAASIGTSVVSLITVLVLLWNIAANVALVSKDVTDSKKLLDEHTPMIENVQSQVNHLTRMTEDMLTVEYVSNTHIILSVPDKYKLAPVRILLDKKAPLERTVID